MASEREDLVHRITDYLGGGGLFNPELAHHDAVRDLLIDCRAALALPKEEPRGWAVPTRIATEHEPCPCGKLPGQWHTVTSACVAGKPTDPDANLKEQLDLAECVNLCQERGEKCSQVDASRLAELVVEMHEWIITGGFLPTPWHEVQIAKVLI